MVYTCCCTPEYRKHEKERERVPVTIMTGLGWLLVTIARKMTLCIKEKNEKLPDWGESRNLSQEK